MFSTVTEQRSKPQPIGDLFVQMFEKYRDRLSSQSSDSGFLPLGTVRELRTSTKIVLLSEIPAQLRSVQFNSKRRGQQGEGLLWWPRTIIAWHTGVKADGTVHHLSSQMFTVKQGEVINDQTPLHWAWSPNVFDNTTICTKDAFGPTHSQTRQRTFPTTRTAMNDEIDKFMRSFWDVIYNDDLSHPMERIPKSLRPALDNHMSAVFTEWNAKSIANTNATAFPWDKELVPYRANVGSLFAQR